MDSNYKDDDGADSLEEKVFSNSEELEDEIILKRIAKNIKSAEDHNSKWRVLAKQCYDYYAGNQWSVEDKAKLIEENRPAIVFNRTVRIINAVAGLELQNRQEVCYTARQEGAAISSEILTGAASWVRDNCDAEDEESQAFKDTLVCGMGWTETRLDYEVDEDGAILIERVDPLEMRSDPNATKRNLDDAVWVARIKYYTKAQFRRLWPKEASSFESGVDSDSKGDQPHDATQAPYYRNDQSSGKKDSDKVRVIQYQEYLREKFYRVEDDQTGEIATFSQEEFRKIRPLVNQKGLKYVMQYRRKYFQYFATNSKILDRGPCPVKGFTFRCLTGLFDRNNNLHYGLMFLMLDPQMYANKWLSQIMHIINSNAKGGYFYEADAFANIQKAEQDMSKANSNTRLNVGGLAKIQKKEPPNYPEGIDRLLNYAMSAISDLVGVNLEMLGVANRDQPGILEHQRKQAGITVLADFFDALRRYRKEQGRILAEFILEYISDGRLIRISGTELGKYVPLFKEELSFKYDIVVDDSPSSPNQKEKTFAVITSLIPTLLEAGIPIPPELLDYAPLPANLVEKWKKLINQPPSEEAKKKEELRMTLAELEAKSKDVAIREKEAKIQSQENIDAETLSKTVLNFAKADKEQVLSDKEESASKREQQIADLKAAFGLMDKL
jgi:hypothetical protein